MPPSFESLLDPATLPALALVAASAFLAGFLRGFVGFGGALIVVMVVSVVYGPQAAVAISSLSGLPSTIQLFPNIVRHAERSFVLPFGITAFAAAPFGTLVLVSLDPALMKIAISGFVLLMVVMLHRNWQPARPPGIASMLGAGAISGAIQGSAGVGGPPAVAIALSRPGTTQTQRANVIGAVTALSLSAMPPLWYHGLFTYEVIVVSVATIPIYAGATWIGARFFTTGGHRHYRNAALLILASIGVITLGLALQEHLN